MDNGFTDRPPSPTKKYIRDPHTTLDRDLFSPEQSDNSHRERSETPSNVISPRASARPPPREMSELFAAGHEDYEPTPRGSPRKSVAHDAIAPKGAGSQKFGAVRVFENGDDLENTKIYRTNPARYDHFDLGDPDEHDPLQHKGGQNREKHSAPMRARTDKHGSQWDFIDFVTPAKVPLKIREQDRVNIDWNDDEEDTAGTPGKAGQARKPRRDEETHFEMQDDGTPVERHAVPKARKDAYSHFDFNDESTPAPRRIIARTDAAKGLYHDPVLGDYVEGDEQEKPLSSITNLTSRNKTFGNHWEVRDSPEAPKQERPGSRQTKKGLEAHWGTYAVDEPEPRHVRSHGGSRSHWDF
jgi:hypothetical protein